MPFSFSKASCIAIGTFNIYIVQPPFLKESGAVDIKGETWEVETDLSQPGFRYEFEELNLRCAVRPDRFIAETNKPEVDCGLVVNKAIGNLKWTPLNAIGMNAQFSTTDREEIGEIQRRHFPVLPNSDKLVLDHRAVRVSILSDLSDGQVFNLQLSIKEGVAEISVNSHSQIADRGTREQISELALDLTSKFFEYRKVCTELASSLLGLRFDHVNDNA